MNYMNKTVSVESLFNDFCNSLLAECNDSISALLKNYGGDLISWSKDDAYEFGFEDGYKSAVSYLKSQMAMFLCSNNMNK